MTQLPPLRIPFHRPSLTRAERDAVVEVLDSGWLTSGERVLELEALVATGVRAKHAVAVNSATAALHLALEAWGVKPQDEVIVPTYTFASCGEVVTYLGARPRLCDVDAQTLCITAETVEPLLTAATKAVIVVHFGGLVADIEPILGLCASRGIAVIEDAAHALPASRSGRHAGTFGTAGAFSFYATKTVTTGEGGMLVTDSDAVAARARVMRLHGLTHDAWRRYSGAGSWSYEIEDAGFKYNMPDMAAALGIVQFGRAEEMRQNRQRVAYRYRELFLEYGLDTLVDLPPWPSEEDVHAWHLFPVRLRLDRMRVARAEVVDSLRMSGIGASVHFIPLHHHPLYSRRYDYRETDFPVANAEFAREVSLPIFPDLQDDEVEIVVRALDTAVRAR